MTVDEPPGGSGESADSGDGNASGSSELYVAVEVGVGHADSVDVAVDAAVVGLTVEVDVEVDVEIGLDDDVDIPDLAAETLARVRAGRAGLPPGAPLRTGRRKAGSARSSTPRSAGREQWSGPGPGPLDPVQLGSLFAGLVSDRGWESAMAEARVLGDWVVLVGSDIAAHCSPVSLRDGELRLAAESTAWATQLRLMSTQIIVRIDEQVGARVVRRISITGPIAPNWHHGPRTVRGHRGPRDTYG